MGQFLCGMYFHKDKCVVAPEIYYSPYYDVLPNLIFLNLYTYQFLLLLCVDDFGHLLRDSIFMP